MQEPSNSPSNSTEKIIEAQNTLIAACVFVIATIMLAVALSFTRTVMIPFVFALFLSYFVSPLVDFFEKKARLPHWASVIMGMSTFILFWLLFALLMRDQVLRISDNFSMYEAKLTRVVELISNFVSRFGITLDQEYALSRVKDLPIFSYVQGAASTAVGLLVDISLVLVFLIFLVSSPPNSEKKRSSLGLEIDAKVRGYIITKVATSLMTSILVWMVYAILGLEMALMFTLVCFLLCFIPTIGPLIATILPLPIALVQYETPLPILLVIAIPALIQILIGNIVEPKLLGKGLDLHPITILLSLVFWALIWGIAGAFLAVPITAVLKIVLNKIPLTKKIAELLAGRSPI